MASRGFLRGGREALGFWVITLGLCALAGLGSYELGRNWVGRTLGEAISSENVQIKAQQPNATAANALTAESGPPPAEAKVEMQPRDASDAEKQDLTGQGASSSPAASAAAGSAPATAAGGAAPADTTPPAASGGAYQVIAGSYTSPSKAEHVQTALQQLGYNPTVTLVKKGDKTYHRVIVGAYDDKDAAEAVRKELADAGYAATVSGG